MTEQKVKSPNLEVDKAIKDLLKSVSGTIPVEMEAGIKIKCDVLKTVIQWEKAKHQINENSDDSDFGSF